jgi:general secretion pathway protein K
MTAGRGFLQMDTNDFDSRDELWAQGVPNYPVGDGVVSVFIEDQGGRLNINALVDSMDNPNVVIKSRFNRLFGLLGLEDPEKLTDALIDWIDKNELVSENGAENPYYLSKDPPYPCKSSKFYSLEELELISGFDSMTDHELKVIKRHLTVHGDLDRKTIDNLSVVDIININTATPEVIMSLSESPEIDLNIAEAIIARREDKPFKSKEDLNELKTLPGMQDLSITPFGYSSSYFRIKSEGGVGDGVRRIEAFVQKLKTGDKLLYIKVN